MSLKRFVDCDLECQPHEYRIINGFPLGIEALKEVKAQDPDFRFERSIDAAVWAVLCIAVPHNSFTGQSVFSRYDEFFSFRHDVGFKEKDSAATYKIFQFGSIDSNRQGWWLYVVLDDLVEGVDTRVGCSRNRSFRIRGVSVPTRLTTPNYDFFNRDDSWIYWNAVSQDFNQGVIPN